MNQAKIHIDPKAISKMRGQNEKTEFWPILLRELESKFKYLPRYDSYTLVHARKYYNREVKHRNLVKVCVVCAQCGWLTRIEDSLGKSTTEFEPLFSETASHYSWMRWFMERDSLFISRPRRSLKLLCSCNMYVVRAEMRESLNLWYCCIHQNQIESEMAKPFNTSTHTRTHTHSSETT